jgi:hypothetical protein
MFFKKFSGGDMDRTSDEAKDSINTYINEYPLVSTFLSVQHWGS